MKGYAFGFLFLTYAISIGWGGIKDQRELFIAKAKKKWAAIKNIKNKPKDEPIFADEDSWSFTKDNQKILEECKIFGKTLKLKDDKKEPPEQLVQWNQRNLEGSSQFTGRNDKYYYAAKYYVDGNEQNNPTLVYVSKVAIEEGKWENLPKTIKVDSDHIGFDGENESNLYFGYLNFQSGLNAIFFVIQPKNYHPFQRNFHTDTFTKTFATTVQKIPTAVATTAGFSIVGGAAVVTTVAAAATLPAAAVTAGVAAGVAVSTKAISANVGMFLRYVGPCTISGRTVSQDQAFSFIAGGDEEGTVYTSEYEE